MKNELLILWTSDNRDTFENLLYTYVSEAVSEGWFDEVTIISWGASQIMLSEDNLVKEKIKMLSKQGVKVIACKKSYENMYVEKKLAEIDIEMIYAGEFLSDWLKSGKPTLTI